MQIKLLKEKADEWLSGGWGVKDREVSKGNGGNFWEGQVCYLDCDDVIMDTCLCIGQTSWNCTLEKYNLTYVYYTSTRVFKKTEGRTQIFLPSLLSYCLKVKL
jgi:hypothetical protein